MTMNHTAVNEAMSTMADVQIGRSGNGLKNNGFLDLMYMAHCDVSMDQSDSRSKCLPNRRHTSGHPNAHSDHVPRASPRGSGAGGVCTALHHGISRKARST